MRSVLITPLFLFFFIINPAFMGGCGEVDDDFAYGEVDLLNLAQDVTETTWRHTVDGTEFGLIFELRQGSELQITGRRLGPIAAAWACTERTFVRDAEACIHMSRLALEGTLTVRDLESNETVVQDQAVQGYVEVMGLTLGQAKLFLNGDSVEIILDSPDGAQFELTRALW